MHWNSEILINYLPQEKPPSYEARFQMHWNSEILINYLPQEKPPSYEARFQMHRDSKILINYLSEERPPILRGLISNALRWVASLEGDN
jgi:hypothetical protein